MTTNNSNNTDTSLDKALNDLLNDTEFCRQFDTTVQETGSMTTVENNIPSSAETTPNPLDIAYLNESQVHEQDNLIQLSGTQSQTTREASVSLQHAIESMTKQNNEIILPIDSRKVSSTDIMPKTPIKISTITVSNNPPTMISIGTMPMTPVGFKSIGTMPMTPVGFKSIGTMPMTPVGFKSIGTMSETPTTTASSPLPRSNIEIIDLVSPTIDETIDLCSPDHSPTTDANTNQ
ncbi:hypothetical protein I4U23_010830 [Adineta vaga]|nr:hypothetical protein I4U23_010830 [Adineta vaga]